ncbi:hypothetical protein GMRT_13207 [Giardia muris]|uniref:Cullin family profile domain-containing protein n=1 Tax=Giardia muris TaxID=5742 RepID=A0A4Z1SSD3_GIAMU|nr:hypothetical protein GMRT_13207 [Giardia muris]|eukprot:TNJ28680.1 hypothetical protein GMRT_13207 [Giardia muris]
MPSALVQHALGNEEEEEEEWSGTLEEQLLTVRAGTDMYQFCNRSLDLIPRIDDLEHEAFWMAFRTQGGQLLRLCGSSPKLKERYASLMDCYLDRLEERLGVELRDYIKAIRKTPDAISIDEPVALPVLWGLTAISTKYHEWPLVGYTLEAYLEDIPPGPRQVETILNCLHDVSTREASIAEICHLPLKNFHQIHLHVLKDALQRTEQETIDLEFRTYVLDALTTATTATTARSNHLSELIIVLLATGHESLPGLVQRCVNVLISTLSSDSTIHDVILPLERLSGALPLRLSKLLVLIRREYYEHCRHHYVLASLGMVAVAQVTIAMLEENLEAALRICEHASLWWSNDALNLLLHDTVMRILLLRATSPTKLTEMMLRERMIATKLLNSCPIPEHVREYNAYLSAALGTVQTPIPQPLVLSTSQAIIPLLIPSTLLRETTHDSSLGPYYNGFDFVLFTVGERRYALPQPYFLKLQEANPVLFSESGSNEDLLLKDATVPKLKRTESLSSERLHHKSGIMPELCLRAKICSLLKATKTMELEAVVQTLEIQGLPSNKVVSEIQHLVDHEYLISDGKTLEWC